MRTSAPPKVGGIYLVADADLQLPPKEDRQLHTERRPVVVVSGVRPNNDLNWPVVLVVPLSSSTTRKTRYCVTINSGEGNVTKKTWARVPAVQPLAKDDLQDHLGVLPLARLEQIQAKLLQYMGLVDIDT
jgi:mRNA-degrading endonuclease toxin of MazEF toxin-antitoxin module